MPTLALRPALRLGLAIALALSTGAAAASACKAMGGVTVPTVVELYTSEGCNSCPPADRWLASLKGQAGIVRLAFHVDYWDRLGWKDRFADPAYTQRQHAVSQRAGARFVYTPQVIVDGKDYRAWPALPRDAPRPATVQVTLAQDEAGYVARIVRGPGAPMRLAAFWAVTEDGHVSQVGAGENSGATLRHDAVVREFVAVDALGGDAPLRFAPRTQAEPGVQRRVQLVVIDAQTARPLQAAAC
ncbi:MAG: DUF1223 domain-containing protein [Ideonella sp.]|nr:DUF1223 domain-containing protein [Ideonella sp.]